MCGLFGFSGKDKPNIEKIKILGLYNQKRGEHSCGVWYNNELKKGFDKNKLFSDFIQGNVLPYERPAHNVLIGHTRWATAGGHTEGNTHPFMIDNEHGKMVIAHNGTISNIWTISNEHGVDTKTIYVDSLALGMIINKDGFKVLNEYKGYAALLFQKLDEPDSLYVYHGASKTKPDDEVEWEERPMFYMQTKEGIYFSSLEEALNAIKDNADQEVKTLPHNIVYKFTKGVFTKIKHEVKRGNINVEYPAYHNTGYTRPVHTAPYTSRPTILGKKNIKPAIWGETLTQRAKSQTPCIYYHKGRYFYSTDKLMCTGTVYVNKKGIIKAKGAHGASPYWFFKGVMIKSEKFLTHLQSLKPDMNNMKITKENNTINTQFGNFALGISKYSVLPVTHLPTEGMNVNEEFRFLWYHNGSSNITLGYTPKFSNRSYAIKEGVFEKVSSPDKNEAPLLNEAPQPLTVWDKHTEWDNSTGIWKPKASMVAANLITETQSMDLFAELNKEAETPENCCSMGASKDIKVLPPAKPVTMYDGDGKVIDLNAWRKKVNNYSDKYDVKVQFLAKTWYKVFSNIDDALDQMGATNILALTYYLDDLYKFELGSTLGNDEMRTVVNEYLKECVQSGICLEENMIKYNADTQKWLSPVEFYIEMAVDFEEDDASINSNTPDIKDFSIKEDESKPTMDLDDPDFKEVDDYTANVDDPAVVEQEQKDAVAEFKRLYHVLKDVENKADEFQLLNTSDMAQEISFNLYKTLDTIKIELANIARENGLEELYSKYTKGEIV